MDREKRMRAWIRAEVMLLFIMMGAFLLRETGRTESMEQAVVTATSAAGKDYIKWVDFTVSYEALCQAYDWDVDTFDTEHHVEWIPLLAYTAARTGGEFDKKALKILNYPYAEGLEEGSVVTAGDVIGYMGHTGYSTTENVNNIEVTHLHWGLELVFDEEQKESDNEIWIDVYPLTCFLAKHTQEVQKVEGTREWIRTTKIREF